VFPSRPFRHAFRAKLPEHFESILTAAGVVVAIVLTVAQIERGTRGLAIAFLVWLQGFLIWAVRRHSRLERERLIGKLRVMLQDRVNNQLTVLVGVAELRGGPEQQPAEVYDDVETALTAARAVARELEDLSIESLRLWEARYASYLPRALR